MKAGNTKTSKLQPKNRQDRACRIELSDLGLNFPCAKSILLLELGRFQFCFKIAFITGDSSLKTLA